MSVFENVSVQKEANIYFNGQVTSRSLTFADGSTKSLGIMQPGEYEFGTDAPELMEICSGELEVKLPGSDTWKNIRGGENFNVEGNSKFQVRARTVVDYCCHYL
jgi:uncharacterized protein YaiE (UPF0345 family)